VARARAGLKSHPSNAVFGSLVPSRRQPWRLQGRGNRGIALVQYRRRVAPRCCSLARCAHAATVLYRITGRPEKPRKVERCCQAWVHEFGAQLLSRPKYCRVILRAIPAAHQSQCERRGHEKVPAQAAGTPALRRRTAPLRAPHDQRSPRPHRVPRHAHWPPGAGPPRLKRLSISITAAI
jgi:hypothetical protein